VTRRKVVCFAAQAGTRLRWVALVLPAAGALFAAAPSHVYSKSAAKPALAAGATRPDTFPREVAPLVQKYCVGCHGANNPPAGVSLVGFHDTASVLKARNIWERVSRNVDAAHMPPEGAPQPTQAERERMVAWIDGTLSQADCKLADPGRVTMRRLNREEYNNTIHDLLGVDLRPADAFPSDDVGYGFDNIGDVLSISPLLMEKYMAAAEKIAQAAIVTPEGSSKRERFEGERLAQAGGQSFDKGRILPSVGEIGVDYEFPEEGDYILRAQAYGQQAGPEPVRMAFRLDGKNLRVVDVKATEDAPELYQLRLKLPAGKRRFAVAFLNDFYNPQATDPGQRDRNLIVESLEIQGPMGLHGPRPESHRRVLFCQPTPATREACARKIMAGFARRAYRRPVTEAEVERLARCVRLAEAEGESFERGIQLAVQAALVSPNFLFRVERDRNPNDPKAKHLVSQYEMASRLSYFLWSSMPDEELFSLAAKGVLQDPKVLAAQVKRMLKDPKAQTLADNFAGQWLNLRKLNNVAPDPARFPEFNNTLREAMRTETEMFFQAVVREDRSVLDFLDGRFTFVNETLARHYGIPGVQGDKFRRVPLVGNQRLGVLTQASVLTVTSNPTRTSPVKRGKWVLDQILGTPPPPPPPGVGLLPDDKKGPLTGTLRQRMEQHRKEPMCASCHARLDPIGFGLENYDPIGRWRTRDGDYPIDSSGELPGGKKFQGAAQLIAILKSKQTLFARSLTEKLLTYAIGRGLEPYDRCNVDEIARRLAGKGYRFSALVTEVVQSDPFRKRRGDGGPS
jgi:mono/diheme cytochrome c family protein